MVYKDYLQRILFEEIGARCVYVRLEKVVEEVLSRGDYSPGEARLIGEALLVVALMSSGLKFSGRISLQLRGPGPLRLLLADCSDAGGLRGMVAWDHDHEERPDPARLTACAGPGSILTLTLDPVDGGQRWQGIVPLEGDSLAEAVAVYFERSEQLPTRFHLVMENDRGAALMLQRMPDRESGAEDWNRLQQLFATASPGEILDLDGETLMRRLFHEESRRLFPPCELVFHCPCSRARVGEVLLSLGEEELRQMSAASETTEVRCQFCNQRYRFDRLDLTALVHGEAPQIDPTVH